MLLQILSVALSFATSRCREISRTAPTISNSLVNLGKVEIAFYLNGRDIPSQSQQQSPYFLPKTDLLFDEPCPCSSLRNVKESFFSNPAGALNKLLMNNDLFSSKDPVTSTLCCESHEHVEEGSVIFEMLPSHKESKPMPLRGNSLPFLPFIFDSILPNNPNLPKNKAVEIFLFPKKKETANFDFPKLQLKKKDAKLRDGIKIVGDRDVKKTFISVPPPVKVEEQKNVREDKDKDLKSDFDNKVNTV